MAHTVARGFIGAHYGAAAGRLIELSTRVDSTGHIIAAASLGCSTSTAESPRERHRGYGTGIAFEIVLKDGVWRIVRQIDRWVS